MLTGLFIKGLRPNDYEFLTGMTINAMKNVELTNCMIYSEQVITNTSIQPVVAPSLNIVVLYNY